MRTSDYCYCCEFRSGQQLPGRSCVSALLWIQALAEIAIGSLGKNAERLKVLIVQDFSDEYFIFWPWNEGTSYFLNFSE
jgi:hypothetical protein